MTSFEKVQLSKT